MIKNLNTNKAILETNKKTAIVKHWDTEILKVDLKTKKIKKCLPVSFTSNKAIRQGLKYLKIKADTKELCQKLNNVTIKELQEQWKPLLQ